MDTTHNGSEAKTDQLRTVVAQIDSGQLETAAARLKEILQQKPDDEHALFLMATCFRRSGNFSEAISICDRLIARDPELAAAHQEIGLSQMQMQHFNDAITSFRKATHFNPELQISWKMLRGAAHG